MFLTPSFITLPLEMFNEALEMIMNIMIMTERSWGQVKPSAVKILITLLLDMRVQNNSKLIKRDRTYYEESAPWAKWIQVQQNCGSAGDSVAASCSELLFLLTPGNNTLLSFSSICQHLKITLGNTSVYLSLAFFNTWQYFYFTSQEPC